MTTTNSAPDSLAPATPDPPGRALVAVGLGGCWIAMALAETVLGDLDALRDAATLSEGRSRVVAGGLLHVASGVLLVLGLAGVAPRTRSSRLLALGVVAAALLAACLGAFGMLHLLALEMDDAGLARLDRFGAWGVPLVVVALLGTWLLVLLLAGLARAGDAPWWPVGPVAAGAVLHFLALGDATEVASHWLVAAGMVAATAALVRR